jgi:hypothetical protein
MTNTNNLVPVSQEDYLDEDPPLRGQNYACLSFINPDEVIKKKEVFFFEMFLKNFSLDMKEFFAKLGDKYKDEVDVLYTIKEKHNYIFNPDELYESYLYYVNNNNANLDSDYLEKNNYQTTLRGLKVRGVFDTLKEAEIRAQVLKKMDNRFNVYVGQVGCWVPFCPNPDDIQNQEYAESQLNTLMKNYKENQEKKDIFYEERKREMQVLKMKDKLAEKDAWSARKEEEKVENEVIGKSPIVEVTETVVAETVVAEAVVDEQLVIAEPVI